MGVTANHSLTILSKDASTNTAQVRYLVQITTSGDSWQGYTQTGNFNIDGVAYTNQYTLPKNTTTTVFDKTVTISNASSKTVNASYSCYTTPTFGTLTGETSVYIDLPRYANFTEHYIKSVGLNSAVVKWNADASIDWVQYSLNGGAWVDTSGLEYTISNLNPNTLYNIRTRIRRADSGLWTESGCIHATTQDIARITSIHNLNHGDNANIVITNPSESALSLVIKIGSTQILTRTVSAGTNKITFSDTELDNIYKLYGSSNSVTATFILTTANVYTDTKESNITMTGNQKTIRAEFNGVKRGKLITKYQGEIKRAIIWIGDINKIPRRCM